MKKALLAAILALAMITACKQKEVEDTSVQNLPAATEQRSLLSQTKESLKSEPNNVDILYHLADLYERDGKWIEEIDTLKKVIALKPDMGFAHCKIGSAYLRLDQLDEAEAEFVRCTALMPDFPVAYNNLGYTYGKLGRTDKQIAALEKAVKLRPVYSVARYNLGLAYVKVRDIDNARKQFEALKEFDAEAAEKLLKEIEKGKPSK